MIENIFITKTGFAISAKQFFPVPKLSQFQIKSDKKK